MAQKQKPAHQFRLKHIKVTTWENQTKKGQVWFSVEIVRCYQDGDEWQESTRFGRDDLPLVAKAADMAYAWIWQQRSSAHSEQAELGQADE